MTLPERLIGGMKVLSNGVGTGVPETNSFGKVKTEGVVGEGEASVKSGYHVAKMHAGVQLVIGSCENGNIEVIAGKYLVGAIDEFVAASIVLLKSHVILHFLVVDGWNPRVSIDNGEKNVI